MTRGWDLVISRLEAGDSGGYECQVVDREDRTTTRITRELLVTPGDKFTGGAANIPLQRDDPSSVTGESKKDIPWCYNFSCVRGSPRIKG